MRTSSWGAGAGEEDDGMAKELQVRLDGGIEAEKERIVGRRGREGG